VRNVAKLGASVGPRSAPAGHGWLPKTASLSAVMHGVAGGEHIARESACLYGMGKAGAKP